MAKAKRVEDALAFWMNQKSFRLSPVKQLCDTINENVETFPAEMRKVRIFEYSNLLIDLTLHLKFKSANRFEFIFIFFN